MRAKAALACWAMVGAGVAHAANAPAQAPNPPAAGPAPTFAKDVAPIVFAHCASCHRPGEVAPFSLLTYKDAGRRAKQIVEVVDEGLMPPWKAAAPPLSLRFHGERRLAPAEVATLKLWAQAGAPEGDAKDLPPAPKFSEGWQLGEPDLTLTVDEEFEIPAEGRDVYRAFVLPMNLKEDVYVRAVEFRPSNRRVTHHALFFLDTTGKGRELDARDPGPGYKSFGGPGFPPSGGLGGWAPGTQPQALPDGVARAVRKGSDLILQTHFHPTGKLEKEKSTVGVYFCKTQPERIVAGFALMNHKLNIPAGEANYVLTDNFTLPIDMRVVGLTPHAHLLGKSMKAWATLPDGRTLPLLTVPRWDFNWQEQYVLQEPLKLPKGTKVDMEFVYDNSESNPANPSHPPKPVRWGEQTTDEMGILFINAVPERMEELGDLVKATRGKLVSSFSSDPKAAAELIRKQMIQRFDKNNDGELDAAERAQALKAWRERK